jgi:hypothetical protein
VRWQFTWERDEIGRPNQGYVCGRLVLPPKTLNCNVPGLLTNSCLWATISANLMPIESAICGERGGRVFGQPPSTLSGWQRLTSEIFVLGRHARETQSTARHFDSSHRAITPVSSATRKSSSDLLCPALSCQPLVSRITGH